MYYLYVVDLDDMLMLSRNGICLVTILKDVDLSGICPICTICTTGMASDSVLFA